MILKCKECGHEHFKAIMTVETELRLDSETGYVIDKIDEDSYACTEVMCLNCNKIWDPEKLITVPCAKCAKHFDEEELDENGCCPMCKELETRGWEGLSIQDLMAKILEIEKGVVVTKDTAKTEKKKASTKDKPVKEEVVKEETHEIKPVEKEKPKREFKAPEPTKSKIVDDEEEEEVLENSILDFGTLKEPDKKDLDIEKFKSGGIYDFTSIDINSMPSIFDED